MERSNHTDVRRWLAVGLIASSIGLWADEFPGIESLMTPGEFDGAGLNKLTADELAALDEWLIRYTGAEAPVLSERVESIKAARNESVRSTIVGSFDGWSGHTRFHLANGQVWEQRTDSTYRHRGDNPEVEISRNLLGFHVMKLVGVGRRVGVRRVE